jgi:hypothetical protein
MQMSIRQITTSDNTQVFLTTHSPIFIDKAPGETIYAVRKHEGDTKVNHCRDVSKFIEILGVRGSDVFQSDAIIFVEGRTDYEVLRKWSDALALPSWKGLVITFVPLGGLYGLSDFRIEDYKQLNTNIYAILDSDRDSEGAPPHKNVIKTAEKIKAAGGATFILKSHSLESYFTKEAIKSTFRDFPIPEESEFFDPYVDMKERLSDHYSPIIQEARKQSLLARGDPIPERIPISWNYHAVRDGKRIANEMIVQRSIPGEIRDIFKEIALDLRNKLQHV